ncbi:hypothetical protein U9M48_009853 [Paspalum notatum var. saurae]|uniref:Dicer-like protein n=1 Tax=Paspalum notatum var. saurae TaxID=547442 RepID=A0AAQ3SS31_PASNO
MDDVRGGGSPSEEEAGNANDTYQHGQPVYFPEELVDSWASFSARGLYHCYNISLRVRFNAAAAPTDIVLAVKCDLGPEFLRTSFSSGGVEVTIRRLPAILLNQEQVSFARSFQATILSLLVGSDHSEVIDAIKHLKKPQVSEGVVYLLFPSVSGKIDWCSIKFSVSSVYEATDRDMRHRHSCKAADFLQTMDGPCCKCMLENSVVYVPRDKRFYNIIGFPDLNANHPLPLRDMSIVRSKRYGLCSTPESKPLLVASGLFTVQNFLHKCYGKGKEPSNVELPPELCRVVMAPVSANTLYSFSFIPSIMYRIQCLLLSVRLKIQLGPRMQHFNVTAPKILEALTTTECQEEFTLESLETLGDSFLKYVTSQHLFSKYNYRERKLSSMREELVSNKALCQRACNKNIVGYIRVEEFNIKEWIIPGVGCDRYGNTKFLSSLKKKSIKIKTIADAVEALIGVYLTTCGEQAAFHFIKSLGMDIELHSEMQYERKIITKPEEIIDVRSLETMLDYVFNDRSLLVEALTHGSYNNAGPCYERLEFLGDAVLDYIITDYFYKKYYTERTPALLTNLRKASVNNCCYAHAAAKAGLHKHILHASLQQINDLENSGRSFSGPSHGWQPGIDLPEIIAGNQKVYHDLALFIAFLVGGNLNFIHSFDIFPFLINSVCCLFTKNKKQCLADLIESIAAAIYLDSKHDKEIVWRSMRVLLKPLATRESETMEQSPVSELKEMCERRKYPQPSYSETRDDGVTRVVAKVKVAGVVYSGTGEGRNKKIGEIRAAKALLGELKTAPVS